MLHGNGFAGEKIPEAPVRKLWRQGEPRFAPQRLRRRQAAVLAREPGHQARHGDQQRAFVRGAQVGADVTGARPVRLDGHVGPFREQGRLRAP